MNYTDTVKLVNDLLYKNDEWIERFNNYAIKIKKHENRYLEGSKKMLISSPFTLYTCISKLNDMGVLSYDLRFSGQSIAEIKVNKLKISEGEETKYSITITTSVEKRRANKKYFNIDIKLYNDAWRGKQAENFRKAFRQCDGKKVKSPERKLESSLLVEFSKKNGKSKALRNIQPVKLAGRFFQMATPLTACKSEIKYSNALGGGIDILSRVIHRDNSSRLCIMELKDGYKTSEPPKKVMQQAVAYATFIARLLRSESGNSWYKLFGFSGNVPEYLIIDVAIVMPLEGKEEVDFKMDRIEVCQNTYLELHSLYLVDNTNRYSVHEYEFQGSLKDNLLP